MISDLLAKHNLSNVKYDVLHDVGDSYYEPDPFTNETMLVEINPHYIIKLHIDEIPDELIEDFEQFSLEFFNTNNEEIFLECL